MAGGSDMWVRLHDYETGQELEVCKGECSFAAEQLLSVWFGAVAVLYAPACEAGQGAGGLQG